MKTNIFPPISVRRLTPGFLALLAAAPLMAEPRPGGGGSGPGPDRASAGPAPVMREAAPAPAREPAMREPERAPVVVDRVNHGSLRHADTQVVTRPGIIRPGFEPQPVAGQRQNVNVHPGVVSGRNVLVHRDVEADWQRPHFWHGFVYGAHIGQLPIGCFSLIVGGSPFYYYDGVYYQQASDGYQEVYPPVGGAVPELPDGTVEIDAGDQAYFYAGGAFYVEQDGGYVIAPPPMGVTVPELPPGAVQVSINGMVAYQFNGVYYRPVFVDGVTQFVTFMP
jgi:hypothetical protein